MRKHASGFTLIELMIVVAIIGIMASLAIPSYLRYVRRSKTMEASFNVRKLYDASVAYFDTDHTDREGSILPRQFPGLGVQLYTPAVSCCLALGSVGGKCMPRPTDWDNQTWVALNFAEHDPYYYQYGYLSTGTDAAASFRAGAYGDLDCNNRYSTFERIGTVSTDRTVSGGWGMYINNEIE